MRVIAFITIFYSAGYSSCLWFEAHFFPAYHLISWGA